MAEVLTCLSRINCHAQAYHDTTLDLQMYYIGDYKTASRPYEGITCTTSKTEPGKYES